MRKGFLAIALLVVAVAVYDLSAQSSIIRGDQFVFGTGAVTSSRRILTGTGSPESVVTAPVGAVFLRTDGAAGTTVYIKESGVSNTGWAAIAGSAFSASSTNTLTNKTLDVEGTGNVVTTISKFWFPAAICQNVTASSDWSTPTADAAAFACVTGTNTQFGVADFVDGASTISFQRSFILPSDFSGTVDVRFSWLTTATTGNVVWQIQTICVASGEALDPSFNTASTVTDAALGTTNLLNEATITGVTITGCAAGELMFLRVLRDPTTGADTLAATARLTGLELTHRRAQ